MPLPLVVLVDANNLVYANAWTQRGIVTSDGRKTGVVYGTLRSLIKLKKLFPDGRLVVVWDGGRTWRHKNARYKSNRPSFVKIPAEAITTPEEKEKLEFYSEVRRQRPELKKILFQLRVLQVKINGLEADDTIGVLAKELETDRRVIIRSSDRDLYQLLGERVSILASTSKDKDMTETTVWKRLVTERTLQQKYGLRARDWTHARALAGDSSDTLEGLAKGVGIATAAQMVCSGLRLPVTKQGAIPVRLKRLKNLQPSREDWDRVNENYRLMLLGGKDSLDQRQQQAIDESLVAIRTPVSAKAMVTEDQEWEILKLLGEWEASNLLLGFPRLFDLGN